MKREKKPYRAKPYDHLEDIETNACSATECTGLMIQPPETEDEWKAYMEVYDFGPPLLEEDKKASDSLDK
ncbi:MAG: hypothetical protein IJC78_05910 [Clostridia bacterium]|nr:hypothetical protein [Clostridia bacterium]